VTWPQPDMFGHSDLGFGIRRRSMEVSTSVGTRAGVTYSFQLASRGSLGISRPSAPRCERRLAFDPVAIEVPSPFRDRISSS